MSRIKRVGVLDIGFSIIGIIAAIVGLGLFFWYIWRVGPITINGDSLYEFEDWTKGEPFWKRLFHNGVASWPQSLGLMLDVYIGPYAYWSRFISFGLLAIFCIMFFKLTRSVTSAPMAAALIGLFLLYWFQPSNGAQSYWYIWRSVEATSQLVTIGCFAYLIYHQDRLKRHSQYALILGAFIASTVHIGYIFFLAGLAVSIYAERRKRDQIILIAILAVYMVYMLTLDGTFSSLWNSFMSQGGDEPRDFVGLGVATLGLATQFVAGVTGTTNAEGSLLLLRALYVALISAASVFAIYKTISRHDRTSMVFLYIVGASFGSLMLIVIGRFDQFGIEIKSVPRYFSYSLIITFAMFWFVTAHLHKRILIVPVIGFLLLGLWLSIGSIRSLGFVIRSDHFTQSADFSLRLNPELDQPMQGMWERRRKVLQNIMPILIEHGVTGFGNNRAVEAALDFDPDTQPELPVCDGFIQFKSADDKSGYHQMDYKYSIGTQVVDYGIVSSGSKAVAAGRMTYDQKFGIIRLFVPKTVQEPILFISAGGAEPNYFCQKPIVYPTD